MARRPNSSHPPGPATLPGWPDVDALSAEAFQAVEQAADLEELERVRISFAGRKSPLAGLQRQLGELDPAERREVGARINALKQAFEARYESRRAELTAEALTRRLEAERVDVTLPPRRLRPGRPHLLTQVEHEMVDAFVGLGYRVAEGPEVESAVYNFDLLNIPPEHPARQEMDTIYVDDDEGVLLRAHTSPVQVRVLLSQPLPVAVVVPGRVYRNDAPDATHSPVFQQVEGLAVACGLTMADLRGTLQAFAHAMFGPEREVRLRPSFFPFTEPSAEVDVSCPFCQRGGPEAREGGQITEGPQARAGGKPNGDGLTCRVCSGTGWIEILGAGMVDPNVLVACGLDPDEVSGFAFGVGIERVAMLRHGVRDIREFYENDVRFLESL
ncbi:MAG: phenylalanine--tRNA ligase subunit alpha [Actinomycetota bacterium]|nr:phenylalanine--tRNA ligase subunit alpha [Actinomycetota bacterium]